MNNEAVIAILREAEADCAWHGGCTNECVEEKAQKLREALFAEAAGVLDSIAGDSEGSPLQSALTMAAKLIRVASKT